jgi:hypothetical protein
MRAYGDIDLEAKTIRINTTTSLDSKYNNMKQDEMLDTYIHEIMHAQNPKATEVEIRKMTTDLLNSLTQPEKDKLYSYIKRLLK